MKQKNEIPTIMSHNILLLAVLLLFVFAYIYCVRKDIQMLKDIERENDNKEDDDITEQEGEGLPCYTNGLFLLLVFIGMMLVLAVQIFNLFLN